MKKLGFLSFGHWSASPYSQVRSASDALIQSIELAAAVEDLGADGAYFRVHHFAQQLASPFPLLAAIGAPVGKLTVAREAPEWFHPGRSAALKLGPNNTLAVFGELHPRVLRAMDVKGPAVAVTLFLEAVPPRKAKPAARPALVVSDLQAVERDFAFVVDERVEAEAVLRAARGADRKLIERAAVFDVFAGRKAVEQFGEGRKSIAISVRLQPTAGTLTEAEIEAVAERVVAAVAKATGGSLRA